MKREETEIANPAAVAVQAALSKVGAPYRYGAAEGDTECFDCSSFTQWAWAQAGVLVLLGVIGVVLLGFASMMVFWMRRAANLASQGGVVEEPRGAYGIAAHPNRSGS